MTQTRTRTARSRSSLLAAGEAGTTGGGGRGGEEAAVGTAECDRRRGRGDARACSARRRKKGPSLKKRPLRRVAPCASAWVCTSERCVDGHLNQRCLWYVECMHAICTNSRVRCERGSLTLVARPAHAYLVKDFLVCPCDACRPEGLLAPKTAYVALREPTVWSGCRGASACGFAATPDTAVQL